MIFTTSSFGGRLAVADLCKAYGKRAEKNANCGQPIVKLAKTEMLTKRFGRVPRPQFNIIGWDEPSKDTDVASPPIAPGDDDSIPF